MASVNRQRVPHMHHGPCGVSSPTGLLFQLCGLQEEVGFWAPQLGNGANRSLDTIWNWNSMKKRKTFFRSVDGIIWIPCDNHKKCDVTMYSSAVEITASKKRLKDWAYENFSGLILILRRELRCLIHSTNLSTRLQGKFPLDIQPLLVSGLFFFSWKRKRYSY